MPRAPTALALAAAIAIALVVAAPPARALAPLARDRETDDDVPIALDLVDGAAHPLWHADHGGHAPLWVSLGAFARVPSDGRREIGLLALVGVPLDRLARRASRPQEVEASGPTARLADTRAFAEGPPPPLKPAHRPRSSREPPAPTPAPASPAPSAPAPEPAPVPAPPLAPLVVRADVARALVHAALRHARLVAVDAPLDALATRARASALLPELRLRALRRADDGQALAPTEYDPTRTTSTTGQSVWLEARATWRLDRLVFADDEVAIERLRADRAEAQARVVAHALDHLFTWQRAATAEADPKRTPEERLEGTLRRLEAEAALDVATDGWFSRWLGSAR
jgi:hypothetical protein